VNDPLGIIWSALEGGGYGPHGQPHDFRARCPGHDGEGREALHVSRGAGGVVLLWCFAHGCSTQAIVERLGLRTRDLFPADLAYPARRLPTARREDFSGGARTVANVLLALTRLERPWTASIALDECPNCEWPHARLVVSWTGAAFVHCGRDCDAPLVTSALATRLDERKRGRA
jgi:hypothetical protein